MASSSSSPSTSTPSSFDPNRADLDADVTLCLTLSQLATSGPPVLGIVACNLTTRTIRITQFTDSIRFPGLQTVLSQLSYPNANPSSLRSFSSSPTPAGSSSASFSSSRYCISQCHLTIDPKVNAQYGPALRELVQNEGLSITEAMKWKEVNAEEVRMRLKEIVTVGLERHQSLFEWKYALYSLSTLMSICSLKSTMPSHFDAALSYRLCTFQISSYMRLDSSAHTALNLFPTPMDTDKNQNLYGLLNKCSTVFGSRLLYEWIRQPLTEVKEIEKRYEYVQLLIDHSEMRAVLQSQHLKRMPDITKMIQIIVKGGNRAGLQTIVSIYSFIIRLPGILESLTQHSSSMSPSSCSFLDSQLLSPLRSLVADLQGIIDLVDNILDKEALNRHEYCINPTFQPELTLIDERKKKLINSMNKVMDRLHNELELEDGKIKLIQSERGEKGYCFKLPRSAEGTIRDHNKIILLETRKDGVRFTTNEMKNYSSAYVKASNEYEEIQRGIVNKAVEVVSTYAVVLNEAAGLIGVLDVIIAFALVSLNSQPAYTRPILHPMEGEGEKNKIEIVNGRHPCLETQVDSFIPNSCLLNKTSSTLQIVTGPNTGGKSTYIRQTGSLVVMAQIGCFVPAERLEMTIVDCILARVGAGDSQLKGMSTFMKEMVEAATILETASPHSLLIVDELGRGTSTYDGFGLAWAIAEYIATQKRCFALFATHFHELTALSHSHPYIANFHVTAHTSPTAITMLYSVQPGPCDRSFGIHVAKLVGFPERVIESAKKKEEELEKMGEEMEKQMNGEEKKKEQEEEKGVERSVMGGGSKRVRLLNQPGVNEFAEKVKVIQRDGKMSGEEKLKELAKLTSVMPESLKQAAADFTDDRMME